MSRRAAAIRKAMGVMLAGPGKSVEAQRSGMERSATSPRPRAATYTPTTVGGVPAIHIEPRTHRAEAHLLYLHGGGYCIGSPTTHDALAARLALGAGMSATVLDYRLAPEHPFPAGLDDCVAAYADLLRQFPAESLAIAGDSAGGGATVATLLRARAEGLAQPAAAVLMSPWVDLTGNAASQSTRSTRDPMLVREHLAEMSSWYRGPVDAVDPLVSPVFADLRGLCPMLIQVGTDEILYDDSITLAERARAAGVSVDLDIADGMWHVYQFLAPIVPEATQALERASRYLVRHTASLVASA
jgi:epsilon-lactone hydrolase